MSRRQLLLLFVAVALVLATLVAGAKWKWHYDYPFGFTHCCDSMLHQLLWDYAQQHGGAFPSGGVTPEASLSKVAVSKDEFSVGLLRGKRLQAEVVLEQMRRSGELTPATCGWNYVEGLTDSDYKCALFWDKDGLDHNGGRLSGGGHIVVFVDGDRVHITADDWSQFLADQAKLRSKAIAKRKIGAASTGP